LKLDKSAILLSLLFFFASGPCASAETAHVLFVAPAGRVDVQWQLTHTLCDFYGLTCTRGTPEQAATELHQCALKGRTAPALVVAASCFTGITHSSDARVLWHRTQTCRTPVLLWCTEPLTFSLSDLGESHGTPDIRCVQRHERWLEWHTTSANPQVMRELTAVSGPVRRSGGAAVVFADSAGPGSGLIPLMRVRSGTGHSCPVYMQLRDSEGPVFLAAFYLPPAGACLFAPEDETNFLNLVPLLTFLRYAGGSYCWHRHSDYANLTIDDPWLVEPYGYLNYRDLLAEMQEARFHTTIGFIPWNFDRNEPDVVALVRDHPEHYSICVHGNNHDHWEFYKYRTRAGDPWPAKPLDVQEANIRQGLARMARFRQLTGLDFDAVMAFPHNTAPLQTLSLLKKYGFLMTANRESEPLGFDTPQDPFFRLRHFTLEFGNFPSLVRYLPPQKSRAALALDLFLDNPVLFYEHHTLFRRGVDAFNGTAEMVNALQPQTKWAGMGEIARHLYLQRTRPDGTCEVRAFCRDIEVTNEEPRERTCFVAKQETADVPIRQVLVDGVAHPYTLSEGQLRVAATLGPQRTCRIEIQYEDRLDVAKVDISKHDARINHLRALSDFRDRTLLQHWFTRSVVDFYYASRLYKLGPQGAIAVSGALAAALAVGGWKLRRWTNRMKLGRRSHRLCTEKE
jgi:hypothetical protein